MRPWRRLARGLRSRGRGRSFAPAFNARVDRQTGPSFLISSVAAGAISLRHQAPGARRLLFFPCPLELRAREKLNAMNDIGADPTEADALSCEIADDALEAAAGSEYLAAWS